jgi:hypothetical protein
MSYRFVENQIIVHWFLLIIYLSHA